MDFRAKLKRQRIYFDGGMGTMLQQKQAVLGEFPEMLNLTCPDLVEEIHREYLAAGCDVISANTFGANSIKLAGCEKSVEELVHAGIAAAKRAASSFEDKFVALDMGPLGQLLAPMGTVTFEEAVNAFSVTAVAAEQAGADLVIIETMSDSLEMKAAVCAVKENTSLPIAASMTYAENGKTLTGGSPESVVALLEGLGVDVIGYNCGSGLQQAGEIASVYLAHASLPILIQPNAGLPHTQDGKVVYLTRPHEFAEKQRLLACSGVRLLGGCCGTTPEFMKETIEACSELPFAPCVPKTERVVSSYQQALTFDSGCTAIGGHIRPSFEDIREAMLNNDIDTLVDEAFAQQDEGAEILCLCTDGDGIEQARLLPDTVQAVQEVISLPLILETSDITALERALRIYNGKAAVLLPLAEEGFLSKAFSVIKKYGAVIVCGPEKMNEAIAETFVSLGLKAGFQKKDLMLLCREETEEAVFALSRLSNSYGVGAMAFGSFQKLSEECRSFLSGCIELQSDLQ